MSIRRAFAALVSSALLACLAVTATPTAASAATGGCYGAGCNGLDPAGRCDGDAITVASKDITSGVLELRYSRSCAANWGRYLSYRKVFEIVSSRPRVTAWNPGGPSYGQAHRDAKMFNESSNWSYMVDGTQTACTGVGIESSGEKWHGGASEPRIDAQPEAVDDDPPTGWQDEVWNWGPCY